MAHVHNPGFVKIVDEARREIRECSIQTVRERLAQKEPFFLVDVREESEFAVDRLPGAVHIGKGILERDIETRIPDPDADIVVYCGGGYRSALAAWSLKKMGYTRVVSMDGGIRAWRDADFPLES